MLFLKIFADKEDEAEIMKDDYKSPLDEKYRWQTSGGWKNSEKSRFLLSVGFRRFENARFYGFVAL